MMIYEFDDVTQFEFACDLILDNRLHAHFDDSKVTDLTALLEQHEIINWQVTMGMNDLHQRTVKIEVHEKLPQAFHYDLTNLLLQYK